METFVDFIKISNIYLNHGKENRSIVTNSFKEIIKSHQNGEIS